MRRRKGAVTLRRTRLRQQLALLTLGVVALAAIVWIAAGAALGRPRSDGPLSVSSGYAVHARLAPGETLSWSVAPPFNHSDRDAVIRAVNLESPDGSCLAAGATYGFPPTAAQRDGTTYEFPTREIVGTVVPSERHRTCASHPSISVGVRRTGGADLGGIEALRVRYEHAGVDYEVVFPWSLTVGPKQ
jgi:hypothetical protein